MDRQNDEICVERLVQRDTPGCTSQPLEEREKRHSAVAGAAERLPATRTS